MGLTVIDEGSLATYRVIDESDVGYRFHFYPRGGTRNLIKFKQIMNSEASEFYDGYIIGYYGNIRRTDKQDFVEFPEKHFEAICEYYNRRYNTKAVLAEIDVKRVEQFETYGFKVLGDFIEGRTKLMVKELNYPKNEISGSSIFSK